LKKVLIVTYYWPPAGGPGVQRWLKFANNLADFDIEPHVLVPKEPNYAIIDNSLENEISSKINVISHPIFEISDFLPFKNYFNSFRSGNINQIKDQSFFEKILFFLRGNLFIPDLKIFWRNKVVKFLKKYLKKNKFDTIITTGPPHSIHLIGLDIKREFDINWVADFRDPWLMLNSNMKFHFLSQTKSKHLKLRNLVLENSDKVIVTSNKLKNYYDKFSSNVVMITNGYDRTDIKYDLDKNFTITHVGSLYPDRNPEILWQVLETMCLNIKGFEDHFNLRLIGNIDKKIEKRLSISKFSKCISFKGYISEKDTYSYIFSSQLLLMVESFESVMSYVIPGKFFNYLFSKRPIIAIGPTNSEIKQVMNKLQCGNYFTQDQKEALHNYLKVSYEKFLKNDLKSGKFSAEKYDRENLTKKLVELLNKKK
jgi:glycosyltransferase involved in cell wall biosynthesis